MAKKSFFVALLVLFQALTHISVTARQSYGLDFSSNDLPVSVRTSYDVFDGFRRVRGDSLAVEFDLSIANAKYFGHILSAFFNSGDEFNLMLINFRKDGRLYLDFNAAAKGVKLSIPLAGDSPKKENWHHVRLCFHLDENRITYSVDAVTRSAACDFTPSRRAIKLLFGRSPKYTDVPNMTLRDVSYTDGAGQQFFSLDQHAGDYAVNSRGRRLGRVENPQWRENKHYYWQDGPRLSQSEISAVGYDPVKHNLVIYNYDSLFVYDIGTKQFTQRKPNLFPGRFHVNSGGLFYQADRGGFLLYNVRPLPDEEHTIARYDYLSDTFMPLDLAFGVSKLHHHNAFSDSEGNGIYVFGGYGNFMYSDSIYHYNYGSHRWAAERFAGDKIPPRFFSGAGRDYAEAGAIYYVFGGFGNSSGRQEDGANHFYDLYRVDMDRRQISKVSQMQIPEENFISAANLVIDSRDSCFYALCYNHNQPKPTGYVYRFRMDGSGYQRVSDGVDLVSERIDSKVYFFYDDFYEELFCVFHEEVPGKGKYITIKTLLFPPAAIDDPVGWSASRYGVAAGVAGLLALLGAALLVARRRKMRVVRSYIAAQKQPELIASEGGQAESVANTIWLLGDFAAYDNRGRDITHRFSSKIKQLFLLVFLHSEHAGNGVSSETISDTLWPEKENCKNIRGVTIKYLRDILNDIDGLKLVNDKSRWRIVSDKSLFSCDYSSVIATTADELLSQMDDTTRIANLLALFMRGEFLSHLHYKWADSFKLRFEEHSDALFMPLLEKAYKDKNYSLVVKLANCLLSFDPLNEQVLHLLLKAFRHLGKMEHAKSRFHTFADEYFSAYGIALHEKDFLS